MLLSCAMSLDGYIDDASDTLLVLSNDEDWERVDAVRASCDAILVGANTIRRDNPRLLVRSAALRADRVARGLPENPVKVTVTSSGGLSPSANFFALGSGLKLVYTPPALVPSVSDDLGACATVVGAADLPAVLADLSSRGVRRLMVEGGTTMHTQLLTLGLVDELHLVVAPMFVGDSKAPRFVTDGPNATLKLVEVRQLGEVVLLRYQAART
ncbi:hypothetical protein Lesp02_10810 [Lentzea sp. NBRC 105346]|nr:hypothetical protein Lesp02_10810 [Lentzea sp. NBRC 105346]